MKENADIIIGYIGMILNWLTWPVVTLVIFVMFRNPISDFLRRLIEGEGPGGWKFKTAGTTGQRQEIKDSSHPSPEDTTEKYVKENPKLVIEEFKKTFNAYWFERAYNLIYGSQISLLEYLSIKGDNGDKYINLTTFYNEFLKYSKFSSTQMADYIRFLKDAQFIEYVGEGTNIIVKITPYGADFLSYIKTQYPIAYKYKVF